jgi:selenocysteine-specific translation elongation factor
MPTDREKFQAEPGDGKPQEMGEEGNDATWINRELVNIINLLGVKLGKKTLDRLDRVANKIASLQQQVAGLTEEASLQRKIHENDFELMKARATAAEAERDRLREALQEIAERTIHFSEIDVVDEEWRRMRAAAALSPAESGVRE